MSRDLCRAAAFLCSTPLRTARSMVETVSRRKPRASASFFAIRVRIRRTRDRSRLRRALLMALRRRFLRMFLRADLMRATKSSSVWRLFGDENELGAAIHGPGGLIVSRIERPLLAKADGAQALRRDPDRHQVVPRRARAPVTQRQVVLDGAALVAMPLD